MGHHETVANRMALGTGYIKVYNLLDPTKNIFTYTWLPIKTSFCILYCVGQDQYGNNCTIPGDQ